MSAVSKLEALLMTVASGSTGVTILEDYGLKTPALQYFIDYCKRTPVADIKDDMALAPYQVHSAVTPQVMEAYQRVLSKIEPLENGPSGEDLVETRNSIDQLYNTLYTIYLALKSGEDELRAASIRT